MDIITRQEALECGLIRYFTGKPCKRGHVAERRTDNYSCVECDIIVSAAHRESNREKYNARARAWRNANREAAVERCRAWRRANPEKHREAVKSWQKRNPDKVRSFSRKRTRANPEANRARVREWVRTNPEKKREQDKAWVRANPERAKAYGKKYRKTNPHIGRAIVVRRQTAKRKASPKWLTQDHLAEMKTIYQSAELLQLAHGNGQKFHVDHIEPLQGEDRRGLHVPWNLQVLEARENISKSNRPVRHVLWKER